MRSWLAWNAVIFICLAVADYQTKRWALSLTDPVGFGPLRFFAFGNPGVAGGYLSDANPWIIRIFFSVLFGFLCIATALLAHFLRYKNIPVLRTGLIVYLSGALGNAWDRMSFGSVIDYILLDLPLFRGTAFNLSDIVVAVGFLLIGVSLFVEKDEIWFKKDQRQGGWVDGKFQKGFGGLLVLVGFSHFFVIALYSFAFLKSFIGKASLSEEDAERIISEYLSGLFVLEGAALVLTFAISVLFSQRLVGPLVAFDHYVRRFFDRQGKEAGRPLRLRKGDYFRERLETLANVISRDQKPRE